MKASINNAELVLLLLMYEQPGINGYQLRETIQDRGYRAWAGVGSSSIYVVLKNLENKKLVSITTDNTKQTQGPKGKLFKVNAAGKKLLREAVKVTLSGGITDDARYNIALSGIALLDSSTARACFDKNKRFIKSEIRRLEAVANAAPLSLSAELLFDRILNRMRAELDWVTRAQKRLKV